MSAWTTSRLTAKKARRVCELRMQGKSYREISRICLDQGLAVYPPDITRWCQNGDVVKIGGQEVEFLTMFEAADAVMIDDELAAIVRKADEAAENYVNAERDTDGSFKGNPPVPARYLQHQLRARMYRLDKMAPTLTSTEVKGDVAGLIVPASELFGEEDA